MIRDGDAELVLSGSADCSLSPLWLAAYQQMGVLASEHPDRGPAWACRPFDRTRSGFAVGEGAAMLLLESRESATRRGVRPWARLAGWAAGSDPQGLIQLSEADSPLAEVIEKAISRAGLGPQDVACVCAHGTATIANDRTEIDSFRRVFGRHLTSLPVVSAKGAVGHLMGAAGAVETALAILTRFHGKGPGTSTLIESDPRFSDLCLPATSFSLPAGAVLKTSLGFGGHLAAIVVA
jgi:3-oxoacyl-(acyl-carrier-protein) synthase